MVSDDFDRADTADLTGGGPIPWIRAAGRAPIGVTSGAATTGGPVLDRTVYLTPWAHPTLVDIEVTVRPPQASSNGDLARCRAGLVAGSGPDDLLIVNGWLDHSYGGGSVSSFLRRNGTEEVFDAVWTRTSGSAYPGIVRSASA